MNQLLWYYADNERNKCLGNQTTAASQEKNISSPHMFNRTTCCNDNETSTEKSIPHHSNTTIVSTDGCEIHNSYAK